MFFPKTKIYTVYVEPTKQNAVADAVFLREGFCWLGFILGIGWTLAHRLWFASVLIAAVIMAIGYADEQGWLGVNVSIILQIALHFYIGLNAYDWQRQKLVRSGYILYDIAVGETPLRAQQRFFDAVSV